MLGPSRTQTVALGACLGLTTLNGSALADDAVSTGFELYAQGGVADLRTELLTPALAAHTPVALEDVAIEMTSDGRMAGGGLQLLLAYARWRFGLDLAAYALMDVDTAHTPLPDGYRIRIGDPIGVRWAGFIGYEILEGPVYPYLDLRVSGSAALASVRLSHDTLGHLATTSYDYVEAGFGPRAGLVVPVTTWSAIDVSAYYPIVGGHEALTFTAGISFWNNERNDEHTQRMRGAD